MPERPRADAVTERAAAIVAGVSLVALALAARDVVLAMSSNADYVSPLVMGHRAAAYPDSLLVTGNYAWFNGLWVTQALSRLPGSSTLGNYLPLLLTVLSASGLGAVAARLWGRLAGLVTFVVPLAVGTEALKTFASFSARAPTWWTMAAVVALAVWLVARAPVGPERAARWLVAVLVVAGAGATLAGDALAWAVVVAPLAVAAGTLAVSRAWRPAGALAGLLLAIVAARFLVAAVAAGAGYRFTGAPTPLAPLEAAEAGSANAVLGLQRMWRTTDAASLDTVHGLLGLGLVLAAVAAGVALLAGTGRPAPAGGTDRKGRRRLARRVWVAAWLTVVLASLGAFAVTTVSGPLGGPVVRYLLAIPFATGALLGAATTLRGGRLLAVPALGLALWGAVAVTVDRPREEAGRHRPAIGAITAAVERYDLDVGYASYWTAYPVEHATDHRYPMLPATPCKAGAPALCRPFLHYISGAYAPRTGARSFLLVDASETARSGDPLTYVTQAPPGPAPERAVPIGDGLTMLVYPFDLAGTFGPSTAVPQRPS